MNSRKTIIVLGMLPVLALAAALLLLGLVVWSQRRRQVVPVAKPA